MGRVVDNILLGHLEGLADIIDRDGEDGIAHGNLHPIHDCHGQRDLQRDGHALAFLAADGNSAAHFLHIIFHDVHSHAAAGKLRDLGIGGETGHQQEVQDLLLAVFHIGAGQAVVDRLLQHLVAVDALAVIRYLDQDLAAGMAGGKDDLAHRVLAGRDAFILTFLNAVVHGVANDMHEGIANAVHDGLVDLRVLADQRQSGAFVQFLAHIADDPLHLLEGRQHRHHPQGHGNILQLVSQLAQLAGGLGKVVQLQILQVRRRRDHRLRDDDLANHVHQLIELAEVNADQALLRMLLGGLLPSGGRGAALAAGSGLLARLLRGFLRSALLAGFRLLLLSCLRVIGLVSPHRPGRGDRLDCLVPVTGAAESQQEALGDDRLGGGGIHFHILGGIGELLLAAKVAQLRDQHEGAQVLHSHALIEKDPQGVRIPRVLQFLLICGSRCRGLRFCLVCRGSGLGLRCGVPSLFNFSNQPINFFKKAVDISRKGLAAFDLFHFAPEIVDGLEDQVKQRRPVLFLHHLHSLVPDHEEQVLNTVCDGGQGIIFHHGGSSLDGMHDPKYLVHIIFGKRIRLLRGQTDTVQLLQKRIRFIQIGFQDALVSIDIHENAAFLFCLTLPTLPTSSYHLIIISSAPAKS